MTWVPSQEEDFTRGPKAKTEARRATEAEHMPEKPLDRARSTRMRLAITQLRLQRTLPYSVGKYSKRANKILPGEHTRTLYDELQRCESDVVSQLRTGMAGINGYLHKIGAIESDMCDCGQAVETVEHILFRCTKWDAQREYLRRIGLTKIGNPSFLGGKSASDGDD